MRASEEEKIDALLRYGDLLEAHPRQDEDTLNLLENMKPYLARETMWANFEKQDREDGS